MGAALRIWTVGILGLHLGAGCDEASNPCTRQVQAEEACGLVREGGTAVCREPGAACSIACFAGLDCRELDALFIHDAPYPLAVSRCLWACSEGVACDGNPPTTAIFECDGFVECQDGRDEQGCSYFECGDGQLVSEDAQCDDYDHCMDGSDEDGC